MHVRRRQPSHNQRNLHRRIGLASISDLIPTWFSQNPDHSNGESSKHGDKETDSSQITGAQATNSVQLFFPTMSPSNH